MARFCNRDLQTFSLILMTRYGMVGFMILVPWRLGRWKKRTSVPQATQLGKRRLQHCDPGGPSSGPSWLVSAAKLSAFPDTLLCINAMPQREAIVLGRSMSHNLRTFAVSPGSRRFCFGEATVISWFCPQGFASGPHRSPHRCSSCSSSRGDSPRASVCSLGQGVGGKCFCKSARKDISVA